MTSMIGHQEMVRYCRLIKDDENWMTWIHILLQILVFPPVARSETWSLISQSHVYCVFQFCFSKNNTHDKHYVDWLSSNVKQRLLQLRLFAATTLTYLSIQIHMWLIDHIMLERRGRSAAACIAVSADCAAVTSCCATAIRCWAASASCLATCRNHQILCSRVDNTLKVSNHEKSCLL